MKKLVLTGVATEHDFTRGGTEQYFLVFNGQVRIPVPSETVEVVIGELYGSQEGVPEDQMVDHVDETPAPSHREQVVMAKVGSTYVDDDGVDQV